MKFSNLKEFNQGLVHLHEKSQANDAFYADRLWYFSLWIYDVQQDGYSTAGIEQRES